MVLDQSALLEVLEVLKVLEASKAADGDDKIFGSRTGRVLDGLRRPTQGCQRTVVQSEQSATGTMEPRTGPPGAGTARPSAPSSGGGVFTATVGC